MSIRHEDFEFNVMVDLGLATKEYRNLHVIYRMTRAGAEQFLRKGETIAEWVKFP